MKIQEGLYYSKNHEWVKVEGDKAYVGITDYAQHSLGDIVYAELPDVDTFLNAGDTLGTVESVKAASDVYCPISGRVIDVNQSVADDPSLLNSDPYENWMICVEMNDPSELDELMSPEEYSDFCK
ncbi:glycine cleavage system H protein [Thermohydrogenium kirishiense]|uniref:Glycine cleavage system H protein n=1 Tax=Thermoanaerobacterium thermosaccharolyticum TaxID=1517 RepID=A0A231VKY9_THETR|nr:glycine cleavage system protein GcvH [Thermoanaerobacterium thermosaccharolyticum]OXT08962.1 glycine cleavage system protein H [Thermoanaerobacterium thermosaccharolyticum]TCW39472.1 glycine cleavage system H protein [Thermohydrogenium kirishiense]